MRIVLFRTLLLIMREMIGTERDYVRSLHYIIDNYMEEMNREDIPQALRGQRNVIFGNVEKICEFHQQYFLHELERCENNPLKVGAVFLEHESKFYLYALYNKNKPKSDALMSEYGTRFFKVHSILLNHLYKFQIRQILCTCVCVCVCRQNKLSSMIKWIWHHIC